MLSKRVVILSLAVGVAVACATAEEQPSDTPSTEGGGTSGTGQGGAGGKLGSSGTNNLPQSGSTASAGGKAGSGSGGKAGATSGGAAHAGSSSSGGSAGAGGGSAGSPTAGASGSGGASGSAGTSNGGTGSTGLACTVQPATGAGGDAAGVGGDAGNVGGAPALAAVFFDDFESGAATKWTTTLGTWAIVDDGSKAYEQSVQENKLQIAIANDACVADQIIDAKVKIIGFKGQSNSYVAALFGRVLSPSTHYLLALGSDGKLALRKRVNSTSTGATAIGTAVTTAITAGTWYDVHFEIVGTSLKGCIGAVCVTGTDSSIASGSVAVGTVNTSARFDDVRVTSP